MRRLLPFLVLLFASPALAGAPVEQGGPLAPCEGVDESLTKPTTSWGVEIATAFSKQEALDEFADAKKTYGDVLGDYDPIVVATCNLSMGTDVQYSVRIGFDSRDAADQLCAKLQQAGGACIVQKN